MEGRQARCAGWHCGPYVAYPPRGPRHQISTVIFHFLSVLIKFRSIPATNTLNASNSHVPIAKLFRGGTISVRTVSFLNGKEGGRGGT